MSFYQQICQPGSPHNPESENTLMLKIELVNSSYTLIFIVVKAQAKLYWQTPSFSDIN